MVQTPEASSLKFDTNKQGSNPRAEEGAMLEEGDGVI